MRCVAPARAASAVSGSSQIRGALAMSSPAARVSARKTEVETPGLGLLREIDVVTNIGQRQRRGRRMPPRRLMMAAAVNEQIEVQLPCHTALTRQVIGWVRRSYRLRCGLGHRASQSGLPRLSASVCSLAGTHAYRTARRWREASPPPPSPIVKSQKLRQTHASAGYHRRSRNHPTHGYAANANRAATEPE